MFAKDGWGKVAAAWRLFDARKVCRLVELRGLLRFGHFWDTPGGNLWVPRRGTTE